MKPYPEWVRERCAVVEGQLHVDGRPTDHYQPNPKDGYVYVKLSHGCKRYSYPAHRVLWWCVTGRQPEGMLDHIDNIRTHNRMDNLRIASRAENNRNALRRKDNTSGYKGVSFHKQSGKWRGSVNHEGRKYGCGNHNCPTAAFLSTVHVRNRLHGEFSNKGEHSVR